MAGVVVVGSLNYDLLVTGAPTPRAGETVAAKAWRPGCGGKGGNQAVEAARHGEDTAMVAAVGRDTMGDALVANLAAAGIDTAHVMRSDAGSGLAVCLFDATNDVRIVIVPGANDALTPAVLAGAADRIRRAGAVMLQNEVPAATNLAAARLAREGGAAVIWNAAPSRDADPELLGVTDILVVNQLEAELFGAAPVETLAEAAAAARELARLVPTAIVTAGGAGLAVATGGRVHTLAAHPIEVVSTLGAGDAFCGALAARLAAGDALRDAVVYANAAAAGIVATPEEGRAALTVADTKERAARSAPLTPA